MTLCASYQPSQPELQPNSKARIQAGVKGSEEQKGHLESLLASGVTVK